MADDQPATSGKQRMRFWRGIMFAPLGLVPAALWLWLLGPAVGVPLGVVFVLGAFAKGAYPSS